MVLAGSKEVRDGYGRPFRKYNSGISVRGRSLFSSVPNLALGSSCRPFWQVLHAVSLDAAHWRWIALVFGWVLGAQWRRLQRSSRVWQVREAVLGIGDNRKRTLAGYGILWHGRWRGVVFGNFRPISRGSPSAVPIDVNCVSRDAIPRSSLGGDLHVGPFFDKMLTLPIFSLRSEF